MYGDLGISKEVLEYGARIEAALEDRFTEIDGNAEYNQLKVIAAMQKNRVSDIHFSGTTGYGYNDLGRETLEQVYADVFHTEDALVRPQIVCGTHALYTALAGNLRPGDELLSPVGKPYDTLEEVIGIRRVQRFPAGVRHFIRVRLTCCRTEPSITTASARRSTRKQNW